MISEVRHCDDFFLSKELANTIDIDHFEERLLARCLLDLELIKQKCESTFFDRPVENAKKDLDKFTNQVENRERKNGIFLF